MIDGVAYSTTGDRIPATKYISSYSNVMFVHKSIFKQESYVNLAKYLCEKYNKDIVIFYGNPYNISKDHMNYYRSPMIHNFSIPKQTLLIYRPKITRNILARNVFNKDAYRKLEHLKDNKTVRIIYTVHNAAKSPEVVKFIRNILYHRKNITITDKNGEGLNLYYVPACYKKHCNGIKEFNISECVVNINQDYIDRILSNKKSTVIRIKKLNSYLRDDYRCEFYSYFSSHPQHYDKSLLVFLTNEQRHNIIKEYRAFKNKMNLFKETIDNNPLTLLLYVDRYKLTSSIIAEIEKFRLF